MDFLVPKDRPKWPVPKQMRGGPIAERLASRFIGARPIRWHSTLVHVLHRAFFDLAFVARAFARE
jgi:hypothetical protein